ncbi:MAG: HD domain-containing protein [Bacilli bacterium]
MEINRTLIEYINVNIIPLYATLDAAHQENHVKRVIKQSLTIGKEYNLNLNMMYTIAAFHDIGLIKERTTHHLIGAKILKEDPFINSFFNAEEIKVRRKQLKIIARVILLNRVLFTG